MNIEEKIVAQNEQILKNQDTIIEMLRYAPHIGISTEKSTWYYFLKPYYMHHNIPLEPLVELLEDEEEPHEKQQCEQEAQFDYVPIGG